MQLRLSFISATLLGAMALQAQDYVAVSYLQYNEFDDRTNVSAPSIMVNKDFGTDYTLNASFVVDVVSGASQTFYNSSYDGESSASIDSSSSASVFSRGDVDEADLEYGNVEYSDQRVAGSVLFTSRFANRDELTLGVSHSAESDFYSTDGSVEYMHYLDSSKNSSVSFGASYQSNEILKRCSDVDGCSGASESKDASAINMQLGFSQNIDATSNAKITLFSSIDDGYLDNPYLNIVRNYEDGSGEIVNEHRPDSKTAYGVALHYAKAFNDTFTLQLGYRFYDDDWDISSHTLNLDLYTELGDYTIHTGLREYLQSEAYFYNGSIDYFTTQEFASSDKRLSDFNTQTYQLGVEYDLSDEISLNLEGSFYTQSTGLDAIFFTTGLRYNF